MTEAGTIFTSDNGEYFIANEEVLNNIKIDNLGNLFLHKKLLGGYNEKIRLEGEWYKTGDIVEIVNDTPFTFRFVTRENNLINVGGYKVNPEEVEELICKIEGVKDVYIFSKPSSVLGNIVCCQIVTNNLELTEKSIRAFLQNKLQEYKIPRVIEFVDNIQVSRTGKKVRL